MRGRDNVPAQWLPGLLPCISGNGTRRSLDLLVKRIAAFFMAALWQVIKYDDSVPATYVFLVLIRMMTAKQYTKPNRSVVSMFYTLRCLFGVWSPKMIVRTISEDLSILVMEHPCPRFTVEFPHDNDKIYLAHCYPYTYTGLSIHVCMNTILWVFVWACVLFIW